MTWGSLCVSTQACHTLLRTWCHFIYLNSHQRYVGQKCCCHTYQFISQRAQTIFGIPTEKRALRQLAEYGALPINVRLIASSRFHVQLFVTFILYLILSKLMGPAHAFTVIVLLASFYISALISSTK